MPPISVLADSIQGRLDDVLRLIAEHRLILATGHVGRDEVFHVVERAGALGVERIVVTHAMSDPPGLRAGDHQTLAAAGVFLELTYVTVDMGRVSAQDTAAMIRAVGVDRIVLSSDLGQIDRPPPGEGLARFRELLLAEGITPASGRSASGTTRSPSSRRTVGARGTLQRASSSRRTSTAVPTCTFATATRSSTVMYSSGAAMLWGVGPKMSVGTPRGRK